MYEQLIPAASRQLLKQWSINRWIMNYIFLILTNYLSQEYVNGCTCSTQNGGLAVFTKFFGGCRWSLDIMLFNLVLSIKKCRETHKDFLDLGGGCRRYCSKMGGGLYVCEMVNLMIRKLKLSRACRITAVLYFIILPNVASYEIQKIFKIF